MSGYWATLEINNAIDHARDLLEEGLDLGEEYTDLISLYTAAFKKALKHGDDLHLPSIVQEEFGNRTVEDIQEQLNQLN
ncbi:hypothetical protein ACFV1L_06010 [Kitasatospora sp. NPDC059646]|uniref:hypothetical protein n=1 Tax=Kitasatospora sp. NPDC059646 TaxID=3346893 RepID=UPI0036986DA9